MRKFIFIFFLISSTSSSAYQNAQNQLIRTKSSDWSVRPLMSVGDQLIKKQYRFVGIPDGLGVIKENNSEISIYMNHEIANDKGVVRPHGGRGAFVSEWTLDLIH